MIIIIFTIKAIRRQLLIISKLSENGYGDDYKKNSSWASINLSVFISINCSGCHIKIGFHATKIKSVNLDF